MAKTRSQKQKILEEYDQLIRQCQAVYLVNLSAKANEVSVLRKKLKKAGASMHVIKNSLFKIATQKVLEAEIDFKGPISAVFTQEDIVQPAKILSELQKEGKVTYISSIFEHKISNAALIEKIANLESREVLLSKLMYLVKYPMTGLAYALANNMQKLLYAINAIKEQKSNLSS